MRRLLAICLQSLIRGYQLFISPVLPGACRHAPTCSQYAAEAVARFGPLRGIWLALCRISRCQPWGTHGYDPVPEKEPHVHGPDRGRTAGSGAPSA